jgi:hypothetical protein
MSQFWNHTYYETNEKHCKHLSLCF